MGHKKQNKKAMNRRRFLKNSLVVGGGACFHGMRCMYFRYHKTTPTTITATTTTSVTNVIIIDNSTHLVLGGLDAALGLG